MPDWIWFGYQDRIAGLPYRPEYQTASQIQQQNYENGRLIVANMLLAGIQPPALPRQIRTRQYADAIAQADIQVGYWKPATACAQPPDLDLTWTRRPLDRRGWPLPVPEASPGRSRALSPESLGL
jgi:hypothetical protein